MKPGCCIVIFCLALFPALAWSGEIYGTVKEGARLVGPGVNVTINSGDKLYARQTDQFGSYRAYVRETGPVTITVEYKGQASSVEASSYDGTVRFNLVLEKKDGKYSLRKE